MKRLFAYALALFSSLAFSATLVPIQLLNPAGSTSGQAIVSTGPSTAFTLGGPYAALTGATFTGPVTVTTFLSNSTNDSTSTSSGAIVTNGGVGIAKSLFVGGGINPSQTNGIVGTTTNNNANAGSVGEFVSSTVLAGSAVNLTTGTAANITSISLTAGDWDVWGTVAYSPAGSTVVQLMEGWTSATSASFPTTPNSGALSILPGFASSGTGGVMPVNMQRITIASTTTIYLSAAANFTVSTCGAFGFIGARRRR